MTNGELFIIENPNIEFKLNGSCVWIYFDGVNHYAMPISWWEQEISLFDKIRDEIEEKYGGYDICEWFEDYDYEENNISEYRSVGDVSDILAIIDKYIAEKRGINNE